MSSVNFRSQKSDFSYWLPFGVLLKEVLNELAPRILEGAFAEGDTVEVDYQEGRIVFSKVIQTEMVS